MTEPVQLSRFRAGLSRALARRGKSLLLADDLPARVATLEPLEAYFVVKELGVDDALPILRHASREQIRAFIDLDCWRDDQPDPVEIDAWLAPFAAEGKPALARAFDALESEVQILFLQYAVRVYDARSDEVPAARKDTPRLNTMDGFFVVDAVHADQLEVNVLALLDGLYTTDIQEAFRLLTAVKWELPSPLAEQAFGFRSSRLQDLGFPTPEESRIIFAPPPAAPLARAAAPLPTTLPALYASPLAEGSLLARGLARLEDPAMLRAAESDLVYLINAAVIAYGEAPGDLANVANIATRVRDTVSLGLEVLIRDDPDMEEAAATVLRAWPLRDLFRHGHHAVMRVRASAVALANGAAVAAWLDNVETEQEDYGPERMDRELVRALLLPAPLYAGFDPLAPEKRKAFASLAELAEAEARLERLAR